MDVTQRRKCRNSLRDRHRKGDAWVRLMGHPGGCRFCGHGHGAHHALSFQPFSWRAAEFEERDKRLLRYAGRDWALKRQAVDRRVDMVELFCNDCAD